MPHSDRTPEAAWLESWRQHSESLSQRVRDAHAGVEAALPETGRLHAMAIEDAHDAQANHQEELTVERLAAHFPGMAPSMRTVFEHVRMLAQSTPLDCCATQEAYPVDERPGASS